MSIATPVSAPVHSAAGAKLRLFPLVLVAWATAAASLLLGGQALFQSMSMDDYMRLVQVQDWLDGQGWFDLAQYRLDPPAGVVMHWSRVVDMPIAGVVLALAPLTGRAAAELHAAALWPLLMLLPTLAFAGLIARRLAGETAALAAVVLVAVSAPSIVHFRPGGLDHHGAQLLLVLIATWGATSSSDARRSPALGGLAAAASLGIGLEMIPALVALLAAIGLRWAVEGERAARATSAFGLGFGAGTAALFVATVPFSAWTSPACDALSLVWVAAAALAGGALALLTAMSARLEGVVMRISAGVVAGGSAALIFILAFPACLGDPYAGIDPRMAALWLDHVSEAQSVFTVARLSPAELLPIYAPPLAALLLGVAAMLSAAPAERTLYFAPLLALLALIGVALWQMRGAASANLLAQAIIAVGVVRLLGLGESRRSRVRFFATLLALSGPALVLAGQGIGAALAATDPGRPHLYEGGIADCRRPADMAPLARLRPGRVLSLIDLGPTMLYATRHAVFAAPYHRNHDGNRAAFDALLGDDIAARRAIAEKGVDYVAICPGAPEHIIFERAAPDGLSARLGRDEIPDYLEAVPAEPGAYLRVFRVLPEAFLRGSLPR